MLAKLESKIVVEEGEMSPLIRYLMTNDLEGFLSALKRTGGRWKVRCACGAEYFNDEKCPDVIRHEAIRMEIRTRFKKEQIIYYNQWAYPMNDYGMVAGYPKPRPDNWSWIRLKLARLSNVRAVPVYSARGWRLSTDKLTHGEYWNLTRPDGK